MKGRKEGVFSEFLLSPSLGSGSVKGGQFSVTIGGHFSMTFDTLIGLTGFDLLLVCFLTAVPERLDGFASFTFVFGKIDCHASPYLPLLPMAARSSSERP